MNSLLLLQKHGQVGILGFSLALLIASGAGAAEGRIGVNLGADYTQGDYGLPRDTTIVSLPVAVSYARGRVLSKLGVDWLRVDGPASAVDGGAVATGRRRAPRAEAGLGDVTAAVGYAVVDDPAAGLLLDVTAKAKFGVADAERGLGTGENDYALQVDLSSSAGRWQRDASLGWRRMGDSATVAYRDPWFGGVGLSYAYAPRARLGVRWDFRQALFSDADPLSELTLSAVIPLDARWRLQPYLVRGLSAASPDWGGGVGLGARF